MARGAAALRSSSSFIAALFTVCVISGVLSNALAEGDSAAQVTANIGPNPAALLDVLTFLIVLNYNFVCFVGCGAAAR